MRANTGSRPADRLFGTAAGKEVYRLAKEAIVENKMTEKILAGTAIGFSGGSDSVMLFYVLRKLREEIGDFPLALIHVNHEIRGAEAEADELFSERFAEREGVPFFATRVNVPSLAKSSGKSLETAARDARYLEFKKLISGRNEYRTIALAHNATDNLETVIFRILRGAGTHGGIGILPVRDEYIRPLLYVPKDLILRALSEAEIPYVTDSTNFDTEVTRNFIRLEILPKFSEICASPEVSARRFSQNLMTDDSYLSDVCTRFLAKYPDGKMPLSELSALHPAILARVISCRNREAGGEATERVHTEAVERCLARKKPFRVDLPGKTSFVFDGESCRIQKRSEDDLPEIPLVKGENDLGRYGFSALFSDVKGACVSFSNVYNFSTQADLGSAIIHGELRVRAKCDGDAYFYGGMTHKLKKLLASTKLSPGRRSKIPVVVDDVGVVWVPGFGVRDDGRGETGPFLAFASVSEAGDLFLSKRQKTVDTPSAERNDRKA